LEPKNVVINSVTIHWLH